MRRQNKQLAANLEKYWNDLAKAGWQPAVHRKILRTRYPSSGINIWEALFNTYKASRTSETFKWNTLPPYEAKSNR